MNCMGVIQHVRWECYAAKETGNSNYNLDGDCDKADHFSRTFIFQFPNIYIN